MVLALISGAIGLLLTNWLLRWIVSSIPLEMPTYMNQFPIDARVVLFLLGISLFTALLFGLAPALGAGQTNIMARSRRGASAWVD